VTRATSEGTRWFDELLPSAAILPQPPGLAYFLRGFLAVLQYDPATAAPVLERAVAAARAGRTGQPRVAVPRHGGHRRAHGRRPGRLPAPARAAEVATAGLGFPETIMLLQARTLTGLFDNDLDVRPDGGRRGDTTQPRGRRPLQPRDDAAEPGLRPPLGGDVDGPNRCSPRRCGSRATWTTGSGSTACSTCWATGPPRRAGRPRRRGFSARPRPSRPVSGATVLPHVDTLVDQAKQSARSALGPSTFDKEFQAGQRLSRAAAIDLALGVAPASSLRRRCRRRASRERLARCANWSPTA
jgi:hypothetical protein